MAITKVTNSLVSVNAIHGTLIADNAITSVHIAQNQVTSVQIPDSSITSTQLAANSVDTAELISGSIDAIHLASDSVTTAKILNANITTAKIANNSITSALIPDGSITDTQLGSGAFTMGTITTTGAIRGPASLTIDPATVNDNTGTVVIAGNLQVDGTTTTVNSTTLDVADKNITLGKGGSASANNGGGITIDGAAATLLYTHSTTSWDMNRPLNVVSGTAGATVATFEGTYSGSGNVKLASFERSGSAVAAAVTYTDATTDMEFGTTTGHSLSLTTGNTRKLTITNAGDVSIADGDLYLGAGSGETFIEIASGATNAKTWRIYNGVHWNPDALLIYDHTNDSTALTIEPGKLGVNRGASSLTQNFEVGGTGLFTGIVAINKAANGSVGLTVGSDASSATSYGLEVCNSSSNTRFLVDGLGSQRFYGSDNSETARFTDGKLGIGDGGPSFKLTVGKESQSLGGISTNKQVLIGLDGGYSTNNSLQYKMIGFTGTTVSTADIYSSTFESGEYLKNFFAGLTSPNSYFNNAMYSIVQGGQDRLVIRQGGNVGIGVSSPLGLLHLKGGTATGDASHILFENAQGSKVFAIGGGSTGITNSNLFFRNVTDNTRPMVITDAGNVGIGTDNPLGPLSVGAGSIADASLPVQISTGGDGTQAWYGVNRNGGYGALYGYSASATYKGLIIRNVVAAGTANADGISFMTNNSSMRMHIAGDGDVGIGTSDPAAKFHVKVPGSSDGYAVGGKNFTIGTSYGTGAQLEISLGNHQGCYVKVFITGDWSSHSAMAFMGEYFIQNGANGYAEPGMIIREVDNTATADSLSSQIYDGGNYDSFQIQFKLNRTLGTTTAPANLTYQVMGQFDSIT